MVLVLSGLALISLGVFCILPGARQDLLADQQENGDLPSDSQMVAGLLEDQIVEVSWAPAGLGHLPPPDTPDPKVILMVWFEIFHQVDPGPSPSRLGVYQYAAVSVDSIPCAKIGK